MTILLAVTLGVAGLFVGAALWVAARDISALYVPGKRPPCHACGTPGSSRVWLPFVGAQLRCASCGAVQGGPPRIALEAGLGLAYAIAALRLDGGSVVEYVLFSLPLVAIFLTDYWTGTVFRNLALFGLLLAIIVAGASGWDGLTGAVKGGIAGLVIFGGLMFLARKILPTMNLAPIGGGDVLIAGMIGAMARWPGSLLALFAGVLLGGLGAIVVLTSRRSQRAKVVPFGPFLCLGALLIFLWKF